MAAESMKSTYSSLGRARKRALRERAQHYGTSVADELRMAVDSYLAGAMPEAFALLDEATTKAEAALQDMNAMLDATNRRAEAAFAELARLRGDGAVAGGQTPIAWR